MLRKLLIVAVLFIGSTTAVFADNNKTDKRADYIRQHYAKYEYQIPMRDDKTLFTTVYTPYDNSKAHPILMQRTPYSVGPYGVNNYRSRLGPSEAFEKEGFIFVFQDVRGRFRSQGEYVNMRPQDAYLRGKNAVDDATDTYDSIEWLVKNIERNNGKVGMWGTSYPGYYTSVASINAHPALKAISPQAPIADWFFDDFHRNGAFALPMAFVFFDTFDNFPKEKHSYWPEGQDMATHDGYQFFLDLGPLSNVNKSYFHNKRPFWDELTEHPNYDQYWQSRNLLPHLNNTKPATLIVGGWYDTEDLYGPLKTYQTMSHGNQKDHIQLVMGPWFHGQWNRDDGNKMGEADNGFNTSDWFQKNVLLPFFNQHLKSGDDAYIAQATVFDTGANRWQRFEQWPPNAVTKQTLYLQANESLSADKPKVKNSFSEYLSDPNKPVPHSKKIGRGWDREYMAEDQRFAARRPDVLIFETEPLTEDMTLSGNIELKLQFSTSQSAADLIVKLVDVFPAKDENNNKLDKTLGNRHELVRWGSIRGRFRDSMTEPKPFVPNQVTPVNFELYDVMHTFKRGHKLQILVQSSMFPFLDRNPQHYVDNIFKAMEADFVKADHRIYHQVGNASQIELSVLK
ncbi:glutaryl-7-ACA acylase [Thalassotalea insulae]|uniref:Glutaryl-7-ACA acylase n=1 Tax=Thalassotalea insulae TaxID=2056778 RepID=A0ABQ6GUN5_9GAMM|nr:CocE/NonD family hydrolase [Thalassotalea insulae]GLX78362.1 glutaryl-7-ACA acylase [Thalassotalea insulae]